MSKLDYNKKSYEDRLEVVNNILGNKRYEEADYERLMKSEYSLDKFSNEIDKLTNYLLNSDEGKTYRKGTDNKFYMNDDEFKLRNIKEMGSINATNNEDNKIQYFIKKDNIGKKAKIQKITAKDLKEDSECGRILREYKALEDKVTHLIKNPHETTLSRFQLTNIKGSVKKDMLDTKDMMKGTFGYELKSPMEQVDGTEHIYFDFQDKDVIKAMFFLEKPEPSDNIVYHAMLDLENTMKEMHNNNKLSDKDIKVIAMIRQGYKQTEIAKHYEVSLESVNMLLTRASGKIVRYNKKKGIR